MTDPQPDAAVPVGATSDPPSGAVSAAGYRLGALADWCQKQQVSPQSADLHALAALYGRGSGVSGVGYQLGALADWCEQHGVSPTVAELRAVAAFANSGTSVGGLVPGLENPDGTQ